MDGEIKLQLKRLESRLEELDTALAKTMAVAQLAAERGTADDEPQVKDERHQEWACSCCRNRLGFYDKVEDVVRIRVKDFHAHVHAGEGGWVKVPCRRCGHVNEVSYTSQG